VSTGARHQRWLRRILISLLDLDSCGLSLSGMTSPEATTAQKLALGVVEACLAQGEPVPVRQDHVNGMEMSGPRSTHCLCSMSWAHVAGKELGRYDLHAGRAHRKKRMTAECDGSRELHLGTFMCSRPSARSRKITADGVRMDAGCCACCRR
jgi:hypothetical protein